jgi:hypothetical protein
MSDTPIPQQPGLTPEEMAKMQLIEQIYKTSGDTTLISGTGVESQKSKLSNGIHKILSAHYERLKTLDSKDEYSNEEELKKLAGDLADFFCDIIAAQKIEVKTKVITTDTLNGVATNVQTGVTTPMVVAGTGDGNGNSTAATAS